ncbi:hypothetical protein CffCFBP3418_15665 [Curtobacterium flaccumfaciens pv. flaccumfaciens]|nr:hypothetical protein CffCFBP3418_15665 [Curtobacterium flaccumfaciens pv. flaccumfaciens]
MTVRHSIGTRRWVGLRQRGVTEEAVVVLGGDQRATVRGDGRRGGGRCRRRGGLRDRGTRDRGGARRRGGRRGLGLLGLGGSGDRVSVLLRQRQGDGAGRGADGEQRDDTDDDPGPATTTLRERGGTFEDVLLHRDEHALQVVSLRRLSVHRASPPS